MICKGNRFLGELGKPSTFRIERERQVASKNRKASRSWANVTLDQSLANCERRPRPIIERRAGGRRTERNMRVW